MQNLMLRNNPPVCWRFWRCGELLFARTFRGGGYPMVQDEARRFSCNCREGYARAYCWDTSFASVPAGTFTFA